MRRWFVSISDSRAGASTRSKRSATCSASHASAFVSCAIVRFGADNERGVVIDERGYILTNYHVVEGVRRIEVTLADDLLTSTLLEFGGPLVVADGSDPRMSQAWLQREPTLVRRLDPTVDTRLATLLPEAVRAVSDLKAAIGTVQVPVTRTTPPPVATRSTSATATQAGPVPTGRAPPAAHPCGACRGCIGARGTGPAAPYVQCDNGP